MEIITGTTDFYSNEPCILTIGKFDGIHIGHQYILKKMMDYDLKKVIFTFDTDTGDKNRLSEADRLMSNDVRRQAFSGYNIDMLIECPFVDSIRCMDKVQFVEDILLKRLNCKHLIVGTDFTFGFKAEGNVDFLVSNSKKYGYSIDVVSKVTYMGSEVSSTRIRNELINGNRSIAYSMLGKSSDYIKLS